MNPERQSDPQHEAKGLLSSVFKNGLQEAENTINSASTKSAPDEKMSSLEEWVRQIASDSGPVNASKNETATVVSEFEADAQQDKQPDVAKNKNKLLRAAKTLGEFFQVAVKTDGQNTLDIFNHLTDLDDNSRDRLLKELKGISKTQMQEVVAVLKAMAPLVIAHFKDAPELAPVYIRVIFGLLRNKDYLTFKLPGSGSPKLGIESDIDSARKINPTIAQNVLTQSLRNAWEQSRSLAGITDKNILEQRLNELAPPLPSEAQKFLSNVSTEGKTLEQAGAILEANKKSSFEWENQRVKKLQIDLIETLKANTANLFGDDTTPIDFGHGTVTKEDFEKKLTTFEDDVTWSAFTTDVEKYIEQLEQERLDDPKRGKAKAKRIATLKTILSARNGYDIIAHSGNVTDGFLNMYRRHFKHEIHKKISNGASIQNTNEDVKKWFNTLSNDEKSQVTAATATRLRQAVLFTTSNIYRNYLNEGGEPRKEYREAISAGDSTTNASELFKQFTTMLQNLQNQAQSIDARALGFDFASVAYSGGAEMYDDKLGRNVTKFTSQRIQKNGAALSDFIKELLASVKTDDSFFEAGHQYRYVSNMGSPDGKNTLFGSISEFLKYAMTAENIDRIYSMEDAGEIVKTTSIIESLLRKRLGEKGYVNEGEGKLFQEIFLNKGGTGTPLVTQVKDFLKNNYPAMPDWQRQRVMQHAFTIVFAGRFRFQQMYSYMNPSRTFGGQAEDKQMFNSVFNPFQKLFRFAGKWDHDFAFKGAFWQPIFNKAGVQGTYETDVWDPFEIGKEGYSVFENEKDIKLGRLAWDMTKHFQNDLPFCFQQVNLLKAGGYDSLRGWRLLASLGVIDPILYKTALKGGVPQFQGTYTDKQGATKNDGITMLWKSIENIGVNDVEGFASGHILDYMIAPNFGDNTSAFTNNPAVNDFLGFLYDRYFSEENEFGSTLGYVEEYGNRGKFIADINQKVHNIKRKYKNCGTKESEDEKKAKKEFDKLMSGIVYDALGVTISERMPLEFLYRLRNQDEQNGLRLDQQMKNAYLNEGKNGKPTGWFSQNIIKQAASDEKLQNKLSAGGAEKDKAFLETWDQLTDDLIFIQSELRKESDEFIIENRTKWEHTSGKTNIFGDFSQTRSLVNNGKGNVLDDDTTRRLMIRRFRPDLHEKIRKNEMTVDVALGIIGQDSPHLQVRINSLNSLRRDILRQMADKPMESEGETELRKKIITGEGLSDQERKDLAKLKKRFEANQAKRTSRTRWFIKMWREGFMGSVPFMADNSEIHKVFLNADNTMVYRSTGECSVAEKYSAILNPRSGENTNMLELIKDALRSGDSKSWGPLKSIITGFRKECSDEIGDPTVFMPAINGLLRTQMNMMVDKDEVRNIIGFWHSQLDPAGNSLGSEAYTLFKNHGLDGIGTREFLISLASKGGVNLEGMQKFMKEFKATWGDLVVELGPEIVVYLFLVLAAIYISDASKGALELNA